MHETHNGKRLPNARPMSNPKWKVCVWTGTEVKPTNKFFGYKIILILHVIRTLGIIVYTVSVQDQTVKG